jgi:hypothetical protein
MVDLEFIDAFFEGGGPHREFVDDYLAMLRLPRDLEYLI